MMPYIQCGTVNPIFKVMGGVNDAMVGRGVQAGLHTVQALPHQPQPDRGENEVDADGPVAPLKPGEKITIDEEVLPSHVPHHLRLYRLRKFKRSQRLRFDEYFGLNGNENYNLISISTISIRHILFNIRKKKSSGLLIFIFFHSCRTMSACTHGFACTNPPT